MIRILACTFLTIFIVPPLHSMTVDEAVEYALKSNPELQAFRLEEEIIKGQGVKARLPLRANPTFESNLARKGKSPVEEGGKRFTDYGFKLSQEFEIAGQRGLRISMADKELKRTGLEIKDRERILIYEVKDAFARSVASKKKIELTKEVIKIQQELLEATRVKFQAGDVSALQVNLAEVELSKAKRENLLAEREYKENLFALQGLLGLKPDPAFSIEGTLPGDQFSLPDKDQLITFSLSRRPDILAVSEEIDSTKSAVELVKKETVPNVTVGGFYDRDERKNVVGVEFSIPIPFFDRKQAERREAVARAQQARIKQAGLQRTIRKEIEEAYSNLTSALGELSLFKTEILSKALENLSLLNLAFREGKIGFFDVRLAQKDTLEPQFSYLDAQLKAQLAANAIDRVTGGKLK
jgi:outer membrane protein, heavy metal efflux system